MNSELVNIVKKICDDTGILPEEEYFEIAELIVAEAFRAGMLYSAKKYSEVGQERFIGNDVSLFLEMEAVELTDDEIIQHFCIEK
jgi:hypothetical protein